LTYINGSSANGGILVFPIGNWTLLQEIDNMTEYHTIIGDVLKNATYFEDDSVWGRKFNYTTFRSYEYWPDVYFYCNMTVLEIFSKSDGAYIIQQITTNFFSEHYPDHDFGTIVRTTARIEEIYPASSADLLLIGGGLSAAIVIALIVLYWFKIRRRS
jgi:hypothetical protein